MTMRGTIRVGVNGFGAIGKRVVETTRLSARSTPSAFEGKERLEQGVRPL